MKHSSHRMRSSSRGAALIEALVGILIFAIGILGLVGVQVTMTRAQGAAKFRADASYLASEIVGVIWSDRPHITQYATTPGTVCTYQRCADLVNKALANLPQGGVSVSTTASGNVGITMTWSVINEGTHTYAMSTFIQ